MRWLKGVAWFRYINFLSILAFVSALAISPWLWSSAKGLDIRILTGVSCLGIISWFAVGQTLSKRFDTWAWLILIVWFAVVSLFTAIDPWVSLWWWLIYFMFGGIYLWVSNNYFGQTNIGVVVLIWVTFLTYFIIFLTSAWVNLGLIYHIGQVPKIVGPFYWHNQMGGWLLMVSPTLLWLGYKKRQAARVVYLLVYASSLALLIMTLSRGSWLAWLVSGVIIFFWLGVKKKIKAYWVFSWKEVLLTLLLVVGFVVIFNRNVFKMVRSHTRVLVQESTGQAQPNGPASVSWEYRIIAFQDGLKVVQKFPLWGVGLGNFRYYYRLIQSHPWIMINFVHNQPLQLAAEAGIIVGIGWLIWVGWVIKKGLEFGVSEGGSQDKKVLVLLLTWGFLAESLHSLIDMDLSLVSLLFWYVVLAGLIVGLSYKKEADNQGVMMDNRLKWLLITGIGLIIFYVVMGLKLTLFLKQELAGKLQKNSWDKMVQMTTRWYPFNYRNYFLAGLGYLRLKDVNKAYEYLSKTAKMYPYLGEVYYNLGIIEELKGNPSRAQAYYVKSVKVNPMISPRPYLKLAAFYMRHRQKDKAKAVFYQCAYKAFPKDKAFKALRWMYEYTDVIMLRDVCEKEYVRLERNGMK